MTIKTLAEMEREYILSILAHFMGNKTHAAKALDITTMTLYAKLEKYGYHEIHHKRIKKDAA